ncbi:MAG: polysaccharide biosynthesis/export family protein [Terriglobia bacterium]
MKAHRIVVYGVMVFVICLVAGIASPLWAGAGWRAQNEDGVMQQDSTAAQTEDAGAGVPTIEPNQQGSDSQNIEGGGMMGADYALGPEDVLTITVFNLPEMTQTVRVENDGTIFVKLLGRVKAAGLTTSQLRDKLQEEWGKSYLEDPHVTLFVKQFHSTPVSVVGAVMKPGLYQLPGPRTLVQVIAMAGGVNMPGTAAGNMAGGAPAGRWVYITRKDGFPHLKTIAGMQLLAPDQVKVDLGRLLYSHDSALDILVEPFDTVTVSKAGIVYVVGSVKKAGGFTLEDRDSLTALEALALAQGFGPNSSQSHDEIIHTTPSGVRRVTAINLGKIMKGKVKDPILMANDILVVPSSRIKEYGGQGVGTALATVSGIIIWRGL